MSGVSVGRAFVFGDDISTDLLAPGAYMKLPPNELATHCLEAIDPKFADSVRPNDILVAGRNFGLGSSREQAAVSIKTLGIQAVLARSFAGIFFRNAINIGLLVLPFSDGNQIVTGDDLGIDVAKWRIHHLRSGRTWQIDPLPDHVMAIIRDGGLISHLKLRRTAGKSREADA